MKNSWNGARARHALAFSAAAGAGMALFNAYRARKVEREHPATGRFVTCEGVRLHYLEKGRGPSVVLLHGNVVSADDFLLSGVFGIAAQNYRVLAFDRPGFGYSDRPHGNSWTPAAQADLLRRALGALGVERAIVLGHSWGALVAMALALRHPDAVRGLVLLSGYYQPTIRPDVLLATPIAAPVLGDALRYTIAPLIGTAVLPLLVKQMFAPQPVPERFENGFARGFPLRPWQIRAEAQDGAALISAALQMQPHYPRLLVPTLIMAGAEDQVVRPDRHAVWLHRQLANSTLRVLPDAGHMVHYLAPEAVAEAIGLIDQRSALDTPGLRQQSYPPAA